MVCERRWSCHACRLPLPMTAQRLSVTIPLGCCNTTFSLLPASCCCSPLQLLLLQHCVVHRLTCLEEACPLDEHHRFLSSEQLSILCSKDAVVLRQLLQHHRRFIKCLLLTDIALKASKTATNGALTHACTRANMRSGVLVRQSCHARCSYMYSRKPPKHRNSNAAAAAASS